MKRFTWRLQRLLDLKKKTEKAIEVELLRLTERVAKAKAHLMEERRRLRDTMIAIAQAHPQQRLAQQQFFMKYCPVDDEQLKQIENHVQQLGELQRCKREELIEIKRLKEGMEKLRAKAKAEFVYEQEKQEQKESDDRTNTAYARKINRPLQRNSRCAINRTGGPL
jgi:flagellar export protein FliJ